MKRAAPRKLNLDQAYEAAYLWLFHVGQPPTEVVEKPPEMVELYSEKLVSWVRATAEVPQKAILAFLKLDDPREKVIFSAMGFSPGAVSISESHGVALFTLLGDGSARPETGHAIMMMPREAPPAPFDLPAVIDEDEPLGMSPTSWGTTKFDTNVWVDCPECGTNQHISLGSCRVCGTKLSKDQVDPDQEPTYTCRNCGSHDIEVGNAQAAARGEKYGERR
jgi:predicted nucleic-acid-binding Zn-ribbon protein